MKSKLSLIVIVCLTFFLFVKEASAKMYAYIIGTDGAISKIDADTDVVISKAQLDNASYIQSGVTSVVADKTNNNLFVVTGRLTPSIYIYDLKTLTFKKDLGIKSGNPDVSMLISPNGKQFFISWFKDSGWFFDLYDAKNLSKIKNLGRFVWGPVTTFSTDGSKIYVYNEENSTIQINETTNFTVLDNIDLTAIWKTDVFAQGIENYQGEKILISETEKSKSADPSKDTLFVYDLKTKISSPRINTGLSGDEKLLPDGAKIILNEEQVVLSEDGSYIKYRKSVGRLHVYDVATGKKLGFVQFTIDKDAKVIGIHPNGNKVYMAGNIQGNKSLVVMDIANLKVTKTLNISKNALFMVFYSE